MYISGDMTKASKNKLPLESQTVEWKQSLGEWKEIAETCAAFATAQGGTIYVGVSPKGEKTGVQIVPGAIEDLVNKIKINTESAQFPAVKVVNVNGASVIEIHIQESPIKPVSAFGRPMKRVGNTSQVLKRDEAQRLLEASTGRTWDCYVCSEFKDKDIDKKAVRDFLRRADIDLSTPVGNVMKNLNLVSNNRYSNAAVLLFGKNPQRFFVEAQLKCARFKGANSVEFLDEQTFEGPVLAQFENAMAFVTRNTRRSLRITGKASHDVIHEYPEEAIREAIINALCHRDYASSGTIQVRIYDDSMEIWNPGKLPPELSIRNLYRKHSSYPHNRLIANAFNRAGVIEHWGSGTLRIINACKAHGIKVQFKTDMGCLIVSLRKRMSDSNRGGSLKGSPKSSPKGSPKTEDQIIDMIKYDKHVTTSAMADQLGISKRAVLKQIDKLKVQGKIKRKGSARAGYWELV